jgi:hypothetical protein
MNGRTILAAAIAAAMMTMTVSLFAAEQPSAGTARQSEPIYGYRMMDDQERNEYRERMRNARSATERQAIRDEHRKLMETRAAERGVTLPEPRGPGAGRRGDGPGGPGFGPGRRGEGKGPGYGKGEGFGPGGGMGPGSGKGGGYGPGGGKGPGQGKGPGFGKGEGYGPGAGRGRGPRADCPAGQECPGPGAGKGPGPRP